MVVFATGVPGGQPASPNTYPAPDELHTNFTLTASGGFVALVPPEGTGVLPVAATAEDYDWSVTADDIYPIALAELW